jgi:hypothetical protein
LILFCYHLAEFYSQHPDAFLKLPISELLVHADWTNELLERRKPVEPPW